MGRFYTPPAIGRDLAAVLWDVAHPTLGSLVRIVDPFCGDGRLIGWFLERAVERSVAPGTRFLIDLWDYDDSAVAVAAEMISLLVRKLSLESEIRTQVGDTFLHALGELSSFDVVITNPPWDVIKPDQRELRELSNDESAKYIMSMRERDRFLSTSYSISQPTKKFSGWGTNLARCGSELALKLTRAGGVCGVVSPASLFADQVSARLRKWLFEEHTLSHVSFFPAEARLFEDVDQPSVSFVALRQKSQGPTLSLNIFDNSGAREATHAVTIAQEELRKTGYVLPILFGPGPLSLLPKLAMLPTFADFEEDEAVGLWAGRELDETGHTNYLSTEGKYLFLKGRMIDRFQIREQPTRWVRPDGPRIPSTADFIRIAWRDVSRPNQKRRMKATLIPAGWVTGNSLNVAYFRHQNLVRTTALLGIMNSFVFEYQVRAYLATAHMSLGTIRKARLPLLRSEDTIQLANVVEKCLAGSDSDVRKMEVAVAKLYGLTREDFGSVLRSFPKVTQNEAKQLLDEDW
jgi:Alw26I/Eco31I/Esp3I family type II restriction m6 adenine DNA methyltransferase